jgi:ribose 5-phosphate isomerase B
MARKHNDANIIALGGRIISKELSFEIIQKFFTTDFEGGRHETRIKKIETNS